MSYWDRYCDVNVLEGKTLIAVDYNDHDVIRFIVDTGESYIMYHERDCCEQVSVEDICGDLEDLVGSEITRAEEVSNMEEPERDYNDNCDGDSHTWTFYKIDTRKGGVTIRWFGSSNGYYSEGVSFAREQENS